MNVVKVGRYWVDGNNNSWATAQYTEKEASDASSSLEDCRNCRNCVDCKGCKGCKGCTNCRRCKDCKGCRRCTDCSDCKGCTECVASRDCSYCTDCSECTGCNSATGWEVNPLIVTDGDVYIHFSNHKAQVCREGDVMSLNTYRLEVESTPFMVAVTAMMESLNPKA